MDAKMTIAAEPEALTAGTPARAQFEADFAVMMADKLTAEGVETAATDVKRRIADRRRPPAACRRSPPGWTVRAS